MTVFDPLYINTSLGACFILCVMHIFNIRLHITLKFLPYKTSPASIFAVYFIAYLLLVLLKTAMSIYTPDYVNLMPYTLGAAGVYGIYRWTTVEMMDTLKR